MDFWLLFLILVGVVYGIIGANININYLTNKRIIDRGGVSKHRQPRLWKFIVVNIPFFPVAAVFWLGVWAKQAAVFSISSVWNAARSWYLR